jgi:Flp pilus assembly protein TadD
MTDETARQRLAQGFDHLRHGRMAEAEAVAAELRAARPGDPEVLYFSCEARVGDADPEGALGYIEAAVAKLPTVVPLLLRQAEVLVMLRRRNDAKRVAAAIAAQAHADPEALAHAAQIHNSCDDPAGALPYLERARQPGHVSVPLRFDLAVARHHVGDAEGAERELDELLQLEPRFGPALYLRSTVRRQTAQANHVADLETRLKIGFPRELGRVQCLYALAKELEDLGEHAKSFENLREGATLRRTMLTGYDLGAELATMDEIRARWTAAEMAAPVAGTTDAAPIFIIGMPRTGTTLVERIFARHPECGSAGELLDFGQVFAGQARKASQPGEGLVEASLRADFAALGHDYVRGAREAAPPRPRFVDKMPVNFLYCGAIRKAVPNARIVHLARDPMDTCFAVYKTLFNQAYPFSYDLVELADYYAAYRRMMDHWHQAMPGTILDVRYEDLVADPEGQARRLLDACGLAWNPVVLDPMADSQPSTTASAAQVREPIHARSVQKWKLHAAGLEPLRARLAEHGLA